MYILSKNGNIIQPNSSGEYISDLLKWSDLSIKGSAFVIMTSPAVSKQLLWKIMSFAYKSDVFKISEDRSFFETVILFIDIIKNMHEKHLHSLLEHEIIDEICDELFSAHNLSSLSKLLNLSTNGLTSVDASMISLEDKITILYHVFLTFSVSVWNITDKLAHAMKRNQLLELLDADTNDYTLLDTLEFMSSFVIAGSFYESIVNMPVSDKLWLISGEPCQSWTLRVKPELNMIDLGMSDMNAAARDRVGYNHLKSDLDMTWLIKLEETLIGIINSIKTTDERVSNLHSQYNALSDLINRKENFIVSQSLDVTRVDNTTTMVEVNRGLLQGMIDQIINGNNPGGPSTGSRYLLTTPINSQTINTERLINNGDVICKDIRPNTVFLGLGVRDASDSTHYEYNTILTNRNADTISISSSRNAGNLNADPVNINLQNNGTVLTTVNYNTLIPNLPGNGNYEFDMNDVISTPQWQDVIHTLSEVKDVTDKYESVEPTELVTNTQLNNAIENAMDGMPTDLRSLNDYLLIERPSSDSSVANFIFMASAIKKDVQAWIQDMINSNMLMSGNIMNNSWPYAADQLESLINIGLDTPLSMHVVQGTFPPSKKLEIRWNPNFTASKLSLKTSLLLHDSSTGNDNIPTRNKVRAKLYSEFTYDSNNECNSGAVHLDIIDGAGLISNQPLSLMCGTQRIASESYVDDTLAAAGRVWAREANEYVDTQISNVNALIASKVDNDQLTNYIPTSERGSFLLKNAEASVSNDFRIDFAGNRSGYLLRVNGDDISDGNRFIDIIATHRWGPKWKLSWKHGEADKARITGKLWATSDIETDTVMIARGAISEDNHVTNKGYVDSAITSAIDSLRDELNSNNGSGGSNGNNNVATSCEMSNYQGPVQKYMDQWARKNIPSLDKSSPIFTDIGEEVPLGGSDYIRPPQGLRVSKCSFWLCVDGVNYPAWTVDWKSSMTIGMYLNGSLVKMTVHGGGYNSDILKVSNLIDDDEVLLGSNIILFYVVFN